MDPITTPDPAAPAAEPTTVQPPAPPVAPKPPAPAATAPPVPAGDSPKPAADAGDPADKRVTDAQARMHEATEDAAQSRRDAEAAKAEVADLRTRLGQLVSHPQFHPVEEPPVPGAISDADITSIYEEYTKAADDPAAFGILFRKTVETARQQLIGTQQHERARAVNQHKLGQLLQAVHTQVNEKLAEQAPDVDRDRFWQFAAPAAQRLTPETMTNPVDRWEFQLTKGIELYRQWWGQPTPAPPPDPTTTTRPATAVMPAGSLRPRSGPPAGAPRTMVDQMNARRERILPGAQRPA